MTPQEQFRDWYRAKPKPQVEPPPPQQMRELQLCSDTWEAAFAAGAASRDGEVEALRADAARIDALSTPGWELSLNDDYECADDELWVVHLCSGGRNDREWRLIGSGANPRAAIDSAIAAERK